MNTIFIENFKALKGEHTIEIRPLTILVGPNNSGKSTVTKAIDLLAFIAEKQFESHNAIFSYNFNSVEFTNRFGKIEDLIHTGEEYLKVGNNYAFQNLSPAETNAIFTFNKNGLFAIEITGLFAYYGDHFVTVCIKKNSKSFKFVENDNNGWELIDKDDKWKSNYDFNNTQIKSLMQDLDINTIDELQLWIQQIHYKFLNNPINITFENLDSYNAVEHAIYCFFIEQDNSSYKCEHDYFPNKLFMNLINAEYSFDELVFYIIVKAFSLFQTRNKLEKFEDAIDLILEEQIILKDEIAVVCEQFNVGMLADEINIMCKIAQFWQGQFYRFYRPFEGEWYDTESNETRIDTLSLEEQNKLKSDLEIISSKLHFTIYPLPKRLKFSSDEFLKATNLLRNMTNARSYNLSSTKYFDTDANNSFIDLIKEFKSLEDYKQSEITKDVNEWLEKFEIANKFELEFFNANQLFNLYLTDANDATKRIHTSFGAGVSQIFQVILHSIMRSNLRKGLIIEEPEVFMHPALQSKLGELFYEKSFKKHIIRKIGNRSFPAEFDVQVDISNSIIIETHSEYLIRKIQTLVAKDETRNHECVIIHYLGKPDSEDKCFPIEIRKNGTLSREFGPGFFDETSKLLITLANLN